LKSTPALPVPPGYKLLRQIGSGGMGIVFLAQRLADNQLVAIKFAKAHQIRLEREFRRLSELHHPNIVRVFEYNEQANFPYFVMEYIKGETLEQFRVRQTEQRLAPPLLVTLFRQICDALDHIHAHQLIHRDLKPGNLMIVNGDSQPHVIVMDFGLVRPLATLRNLTVQDAIIGAPTYTPPEQLASTVTVTFKADLYSLGVLMYESAAGQLPFPGDPAALAQAAVGQLSKIEAKQRHTIALKQQHIFQAPRPPHQLVNNFPAPLEQLILRLLAKRPDDRPPSAAWVRDQLGHF
jgi:serine/threonine-protein kinase